MLPFVIRPTTPADYAQWLPLWEGYNAFYGREGATALTPSITATTWRRFHDPAEPMHALVAESGGVLVGLAHYLFHRSTILVEPTCYLQDLFTNEDSRGHGVARRLITEVCSSAAASGATRVYWQTQETNLRAIRLYEQLAERSGFIVFRKPV